MLEESDAPRSLAGKYVDTYAFVDGRFEVRAKGRSLPCKIFDMDQCVTHAAITGNKRLGAVPDHTNSEKTGCKRNGKPPRRPAGARAKKAIVQAAEQARN